MKYEPHDYQVYASEYIKEHDAAAVFLECGLGKTSITLTAIRDLMFDSFKIHKVLIIGPIRVVTMSWPDEIKKWDHTSDLRYSVAVGTESERMAALEAQADLYLINRENVQWLVEKSGLPFDYDMVVVDELSSFKNWQAKRFKALMKVRPKVKRIVGLTGTPSSNGLMDLFAEYKLLDMGRRLGRFIGQYRNRYFVPDKTNGHVVYSYKLLPGAEEAIYDRISDITISMKSADRLKMPELVNSRYMVRLDEPELVKYERMKRDLLLKLPEGEVTAANAQRCLGSCPRWQTERYILMTALMKRSMTGSWMPWRISLRRRTGKRSLRPIGTSMTWNGYRKDFPNLRLAASDWIKSRTSSGGMRGKSLWGCSIRHPPDTA